MSKFTRAITTVATVGLVYLSSCATNHDACNEQQNISWEDGYVNGMFEGDANGYARGANDHTPRDAYVISGWPSNREIDTLPGLRVNLNNGRIINMKGITERVSPESIEQGNSVYEIVSDEELLSGVKP